MHQVEALRDQRRFPALDMADHVPFYSGMRTYRFNLLHSLFRIILSEDVRTGFDGSPHDFHGLQLGDDHQPDSLAVPSALAGGNRDGIHDTQVAFLDRSTEIRHGLILPDECKCYGFSAISAPNRPVFPFSAR